MLTHLLNTPQWYTYIRALSRLSFRVFFPYIYNNEGNSLEFSLTYSGVGDKVNFLGRDGVTVVISSGSEFQVLSKNTLDDKFDASPVIVGDEIYLRGHQYLYCISK